MVAIERGEGDIASEHLSNIDAPDLEYSLSLLEGNLKLRFLMMLTCVCYYPKQLED